MDQRIPAEALRELVERLFIAAGLSADDARLCADTFLLQEMRGVTTHGLRRVRSNVDGLRRGRLKAGPDRRVLRDDGATIVLDGDRGLGVLACIDAMDRAVAKARSHGIGMCVVGNSNHFLGAAPYCIRAAGQGLIGVAASNSFGIMSYPGTNAPILGNSPIGYAIPTGGDFDLVFDAALTTSAGKLSQWVREGERIPDAMLGLDAEGNLTSDPKAVLDGGTTVPIGLHKGAGLTLLFEVLTGVLGHAGFLHGDVPASPMHMEAHSQVCIAIDVEHLMPVALFQERMAAYVNDIKSSPLAPGQDEILLPGERAHRSVKDCEANGVPVEADVIEDLRACAGQLGVKTPF